MQNPVSEYGKLYHRLVTTPIDAWNLNGIEATLILGSLANTEEIYSQLEIQKEAVKILARKISEINLQVKT